MSHTTPFILVTVLLTAGWVAELSAQTPSVATSATRRSNLFSASRVEMFRSSGGLNVERDELQAKRSLQQGDSMMDLVSANDPSMLAAANVPGINLFLTTNGSMLQAMNLTADPTAAISGQPALIIAESSADDANIITATSMIPGTRMYAPRLRFVHNEEDLKAMEAPEAIAQMEEADRQRCDQLVTVIIDKFDLPPTANMSLEFHGLTARIQGRVPNPTVRKQIGMYLGFEPGIYSVENHLEIDPSMDGLPTTTPAP